uniref:Uncharacterized protein n=1 Tax=Utricularia reniformis TaxID=192314 RepID=A0A1Y0B2A0_9LAMI|nr:hypothetical protein AEK19_MT1317 [Utricularia reniformis]ART31517.1 hypothetical protein AEK19_MT1317 [Utricularia reniformis]
MTPSPPSNNVVQGGPVEALIPNVKNLTIQCSIAESPSGRCLLRWRFPFFPQLIGGHILMVVTFSSLPKLGNLFDKSSGL